MEDAARAAALRLAMQPSPDLALPSMQVRTARRVTSCSFRLLPSARTYCTASSAAPPASRSAAGAGIARLLSKIASTSLCSRRWGARLEEAAYKTKHRMYLSEQTDGSEPNKLVVYTAEVPKVRHMLITLSTE